MGFSVPKHGESRPRKAAIRWLVTASDFGGFERALHGGDKEWLMQGTGRSRRYPMKTDFPKHRTDTPESETVAYLVSAARRREHNWMVGRHFAKLFFKPMSVKERVLKPHGRSC